MTTTRRDFLRRTSLALAGGLVLGDQVMELYDRLTHRKVFVLGGVPDPWADWRNIVATGDIEVSTHITATQLREAWNRMGFRPNTILNGLPYRISTPHVALSPSPNLTVRTTTHKV